jgi:transmembrane sensor
LNPGVPSSSTAIALTQREQECAKWLARLERGMRNDEGRQLKEWLTDPRNREAILEAADLWHSRDVQSLLFALTGVSPQRRHTAPRKRTILFPLVVALLSTGALVYMVTGGHHRSPVEKQAPAIPSTPYATAIGETREMTLGDGTQITLNTNTRISVSFSQQAREVVLVRGEATFNVAPEATPRPFNVIAGQRTFQAIGTRFNVRTLRDNVDLIVMEGKVKILDARPTEPTTPARRRDVLTYGEQTINAFEEALVDPGFQSVSPIDASEVQVRLAWQKGLIIVEDRTLGDALAEVQRYTPVRFVLADERLGALRVSGSFRTGNVNSVRVVLRQNFFVASRRDTRGRIVLSQVHTTCRSPQSPGGWEQKQSVLVRRPAEPVSGRFFQRDVDRHVHEAGMQLQFRGRDHAGVVERDRPLPEVDVLGERDLVAVDLAALDRQRAAVRPEAGARERRAVGLEGVDDGHGAARRVDRAAPFAVDVRGEGRCGGQ